MSAQRAKGTRFETACADFLVGKGFVHVERRAGSGRNDRGDLAGVPGWVFECKNHRGIDLGAFMHELEVEKKNAGCSDGVLIVNRRQHAIGKSYAIVDLDLFADMLKAYEGA